MRRARRVIAVSESTKRDLVREYGISPDKGGRGSQRRGRQLSALCQAIRWRHFGPSEGLPERFILFVGTLEPRKNVARLIEAYARLPKDAPAPAARGGQGLALRRDFCPRRGAGPGRRGASLSAMCPARTCPGGTMPPICLSTPPSTRDLACRPWRRWPAARRSSPPHASSLPEVVGEAGLLVDADRHRCAGRGHGARCSADADLQRDDGERRVGAGGQVFLAKGCRRRR